MHVLHGQGEESQTRCDDVLGTNQREPGSRRGMTTRQAHTNLLQSTPHLTSVLCAVALMEGGNVEFWLPERFSPATEKHGISPR